MGDGEARSMEKKGRRTHWPRRDWNPTPKPTSSGETEMIESGFVEHPWIGASMDRRGERC